MALWHKTCKAEFHGKTCRLKRGIKARLMMKSKGSSQGDLYSTFIECVLNKVSSALREMVKPGESDLYRTVQGLVEVFILIPPKNISKDTVWLQTKTPRSIGR